MSVHAVYHYPNGATLPGDVVVGDDLAVTDDLTAQSVNGVEIYTGSGDPTSGGGQAATRPALYLRTGTDEIYQKTGAGDTAWTRVPNRAWTPVGPFGRNNIAANQANISAGFDSTAARDSWVAPAACRVVAMSYHVDTTGGTVGSITVSVAHNGSDAGVDYDDTEACVSPDIYGYAVYGTPLSVAAGDRLGVLISTTADWTGSTGDLIAFLFVEFT